MPPPPANFTSGALSRLYFRVVPDDPAGAGAPVVGAGALVVGAGALVVGAGVLAAAILLLVLAAIVVLVDNARLVNEYNDVVAATAMPFKKPRRGKSLILGIEG